MKELHFAQETVEIDGFTIIVTIGDVRALPVKFKDPKDIPLLYLPGKNGESAFYIHVDSSLAKNPIKRSPEIDTAIMSAFIGAADDLHVATGAEPLWFDVDEKYEGWHAVLTKLLGNYAQHAYARWGAHGELTSGSCTVGAWPGLSYGAHLIHTTNFDMLLRRTTAENEKHRLYGKSVRLPLSKTMTFGKSAGRLDFGFVAEPCVFRHLRKDPGTFGGVPQYDRLKQMFMPNIPERVAVLALPQYIAWVYGAGKRTRPASDYLITDYLIEVFTRTLSFAPAFTSVMRDEADMEATMYVRRMCGILHDYDEAKAANPVFGNDVLEKFRRYFTRIE